MAMNTRVLGRGIQTLFEGNGETSDQTQAAPSPLTLAPVSAITPNPAQPRENFSETALAELASSIASHGVLQPLLVRPAREDGQFQLIAGERRLRAAQLAGLAEVPVLVRDIDDHEALIVTLLENLQREDLNPIEEAKGLEALRNAMNVSVEQLAETLGQGRSTIAHSLRLLRLDPAIQEDLAAGRLTTSHAKSLGAMPAGPALHVLRQRIIETGMTTRETEEAIAFWHEHGHFAWENESAETEAIPKKREPKPVDPDMRKLADNIGATLNCRAKISGSPEKGRISIAYESNAQLYDLLEKFGLQLTP